MADTIMDLKKWFDLSMEELTNQFNSGQYNKLSDCPLYEECETYRRTLNYLTQAIFFGDTAQRLWLDEIETMIVPED